MYSLNHALEYTAVLPRAEVVLHRCERRKTPGNRPPLASHRQHVPDRVQELPRKCRGRKADSPVIEAGHGPDGTTCPAHEDNLVLRQFGLLQDEAECLAM